MHKEEKRGRKLKRRFERTSRDLHEVEMVKEE